MRDKFLRPASFLFALGLAALFGGCSTFTYDWRQAAKQPTPTNDITGRWDGSWMSTANGHRGALRCLVTKRADGGFDARYRATYQRVFTFSYTVPLRPQSDADTAGFRGEADLGWLAGGLYKYEGRARPTNFFSTYDSKYDQGTFQMTRPQE